jgi:hypothetical protein
MIVPKRWQTIRKVNTTFRSSETDDRTVITLETSAVALPTAWVNFLKQRLHVLHLDCKYVGAGKIVVTSTPRAAESVARLVYSAMESANDYFKTLLRSMQADRDYGSRLAFE